MPGKQVVEQWKAYRKVGGLILLIGTPAGAVLSFEDVIAEPEGLIILAMAPLCGLCITLYGHVRLWWHSR